MPQELQEWLPRHEILTYEETRRLIRIAAELGVSKVRITGGEPLTRRGIVDFVRQVPEIPGITSIGLSTNGTLLAREISPGRRMAEALRDAGVQSVNISLDTLDGPATYYQIPGRAQRVGFIGAMTNMHFCENCNKLRLTCDGKLRPCLGSYLEFDIMGPLRAGASDEQLKEFFLNVVDRKPREHDFRNNYQPNRKMIAIGG